MLSDFCDRLRPLALTLLRLAVGVVFLSHGWGKVSDLPKWSGNFIHMGFPGWVAYCIGPLEFVGGALLVLGLFSRLVGLLLAGDMLVALLKVHLPGGPLFPTGRFEEVMILSAAAFTLFAFGGGPVALDRVFFGGRRSRSARARGAGSLR
ncbi:MAG TPA: DoxX family protein [Terriglobales bacterium]|nr:DoxX family protein [Terriglobales bacterium]